MSTDTIERALQIRTRILNEADRLVDIDPIELRELAYEASDVITDLVANLRRELSA